MPVAFTSQLAKNWTFERLKTEELLGDTEFAETKRRKANGSFNIDLKLGGKRRQISFHTLPSPSPRATDPADENIRRRYEEILLGPRPSAIRSSATHF